MPRTTSGVRQLVRDFGTCLAFTNTVAQAGILKASSVGILRGSTNLTISAFVKLGKAPPVNGASIYCERPLSSGNDILKMVVRSTGFLGLTYRDDAGTLNSMASTYQVPYGNWIHLAIVKVGTTVNYYANGVAVGGTTTITATDTLTNSNIITMVGNDSADYNSSNNNSVGVIKIDEIQVYNTNLSTTQLQTIINGGTVSGCLGYWKFDEGSGATLNDTAGIQSAGNLEVATYSTDVFIKPRTVAGSRRLVRDFGTCLNFAGGADRITFTVPTSMNPANLTQFTLAVWVNFGSFSTAVSTRIFDNNLSQAGFNLLYSTASNRFDFGVQTNANSGSASWGSDVFAKKGTWRRMLVTWDDAVGTPSLYLDGASYTPVFTQALTGTRQNWSGTTAYIGNRSGNDRGFSGKMDEFTIWNRVLTATEISDDFYKGPPNTPLLRYKLDEGSGTTATDSGSAGVNGTIATATYSTDVFIKPRTAI